MKRPLALLALLVLVPCVAACSGGPEVPIVSDVIRAPEPDTILIRNASNAWLDTLTVEEDGKDRDGAQRLGRISPAGPATQQLIYRGDDSPPLAPTATISWSQKGKGSFNRTVSVRDALTGARIRDDSVLVFEVAPGGEARVFVTDRRALGL